MEPEEDDDDEEEADDDDAVVGAGEDPVVEDERGENCGGVVEEYGEDSEVAEAEELVEFDAIEDNGTVDEAANAAAGEMCGGEEVAGRVEGEIEEPWEEEEDVGALLGK